MVLAVRTFKPLLAVGVYGFGGDLSTIFVRARRSYYARLFVPKTLRAILGKAEIWRSLQTSSAESAKLKAAVWEGRVARLFGFLVHRQQRMTPSQLTKLCQLYITTALENGEANRCTRTLSDDEREAVSLALTDLLEDTQHSLLNNNMMKVSETADDLLQTHGLTLDKHAPEYHQLCRELLKAQQVIYKGGKKRGRESLLMVSLASGAHYPHRRGAGSRRSPMIRLMATQTQWCLCG